MISLNYRDARPIYEQIKDGLRRLIVSGALQTDERLPSVRTLAAQLAINPNTIQRAYNELEKEGYIYQSTAPYLLAHAICRVFAMEDAAESLGEAARAHAAQTHDPDQNLQDLLNIYQTLA